VVLVEEEIKRLRIDIKDKKREYDALKKDIEAMKKEQGDE